ncbi:hypothetical protein [Kordiimonas sp. SCSIO 12610]|uniref:hypothetical protein n=1 Tax=Kordiimonas sp. SCSIO 12610 TaxID=2829597 RepID=UPI002109E845|nr:hypothetical protein [Kordiimonas sp. SCSIO 12610]UTW56181.1 hypothetical protein KFF44_04595 [Kordiimonas sp. SCSIO 12610]
MALSAQGPRAIITLVGEKAKLNAYQTFSPTFLPQSEYARLHLLRRGILVSKPAVDTSFSGQGVGALARTIGFAASIRMASRQVFAGTRGLYHLIGRSARLEVGFGFAAVGTLTAAKVSGGVASLQTATTQRLMGVRASLTLLGRASNFIIASSTRIVGIRAQIRLVGRIASVTIGAGVQLTGLRTTLSLVGANAALQYSSNFMDQGLSAGLRVTGRRAILRLSGFGSLSLDRQVIPFRHTRMVKPEVMRAIKPDRRRRSLRA